MQKELISWKNSQMIRYYTKNGFSFQFEYSKDKCICRMYAHKLLIAIGETETTGTQQVKSINKAIEKCIDFYIDGRDVL